MSINDRLNELLGANQAKRLAEDKARDERRDNPRILRHTTYQGDRNIQQLGDEIIENGVVLNNQSVAIGDVMLPLAKGNVLRRVDNTNGGALLGSAYRKALENDYDANGNRRNNALSRNGGDEDPDPSNPNDPRNKPKLPPSSPPPFGCSPPPPQCLWTSDPNVPNGYQSYGSAVVNENGIELFLYCTAGTAVAPDLGCDFLKPADKWRCSGGVCAPDANGIYNTQAECEAALIPPEFTGGQCVGTNYQGVLEIKVSTDPARPLYYSWNTGGSGTLIGADTIPSVGLWGITLTGPITGVTMAEVGGEYRFSVNGIWVASRTVGGSFGTLVSFKIAAVSGSPDTCGNLPSSCPT
jgi:hypothetical protein